MNKLSVIAISLLSALAATQVSAATDTTGFYVGGALNKLTVDFLDETATGAGVYGGYNFNEWSGLEANLFGTSDLDTDLADISAYALSFTPKFTAQINDIFSVYAKVGIATILAYVDSYSINEDITGYGWVYGVGVNAAVTENLNIRVSYNLTKGNLQSDGPYIVDFETDIKQLAVGMHYQF
ncbi:MAG: porin family protein [Shewanella sp.]